jgi:two-component system, response regulator PdtaR
VVQEVDVRESSNRIPLRILVAEDDPLVRRDLCESLESAGFAVCAEAQDGLEAVALARSTLPDVALVDVEMPRLDGLEACRRIVAERPIPVVVLTGHAEDDVVSRAVAAGAFGSLLKPFREEGLAPAIQTAVARHAELASVQRRAADTRVTFHLPTRAGRL